MSPVFAFLQVSAEAHGLHPEILGYGEVAWWPDGLGTKINALRRFVFGPLADQDIVVFLDAFDVMVFGGKDLLVEKFVAMERQRNRSLFFNAEAACFPPFDDICTPNYPQSPHEQWRYLNSGMIIGRVSAMRHMLQEPVDNIIKGSDQAFYQRHFLRYPDEVGLDYSCSLLCATQVIGHKHGIVIQDRQAVNLLTGENIALVHFVSMGHWTIWKSGSPTTIIGDVFGDLYPEEYERLFGSVNFFLQVGSAHWVVLAELRGRAHDAYCAIARMVLCCKCRLFLSGDRECTYARTLLGSFCFHTSVFLLLVICLPISAIFVRRRRYVSVNAHEKEG
jgi:hypothetical protein